MCYANDLVDNSLIEHGKLIPYLEFCSPEKAILEVIEIVRSDFEGKQIGFELFLEQIRRWNMELDRQRLQQVLLNLAKNAIKFSHIGGESIELIANIISKEGCTGAHGTRSKWDNQRDVFFS